MCTVIFRKPRVERACTALASPRCNLANTVSPSFSINTRKASHAIYNTFAHLSSRFMVSAIKLCPVRFRAPRVFSQQGYVGYRAASNQKHDAITAGGPTSVAPSIAEKYRSPGNFYDSANSLCNRPVVPMMDYPIRFLEILR
ncbi:hypothetical protein ANTRET_LOCUS2660 [Anthophora retusa]